MADYTREQLFDALRKADAAGDAEAAKALTSRIRSLDAGGADAVTQAISEGKSREEILAVAQQRGLEVNPQDLDANLAARQQGMPTGQAQNPSNFDYLKDSAVNIGAGMAEGALGVAEFPIEAASELGRGMRYGLRQGGGALLDAVGAESAADWWRGDGGEQRNALLDIMPSDQIGNALPTPAGMEGQRFASQVVGGMAVPFGPKPAPRPAARPAQAQQQTAAQQIVQTGKDEGVRVMTTDVKPPRGFVGKSARAIGERIPFAGTGGPRIAQNEERVQAVRNVAADYGAEAGQEYLEGLADDFSRTRGAAITKWKDRKDAVIQGIQAPFTEAPRAIAAIDEQVAKLRGIDADEYKPVIDRLLRFRDQFTQGKSLEQIEGQRRLLSGLFDDPSLAKLRDDGKKAINAIYKPLREDMGEFIGTNGGAKERRVWEESNRQLSRMVGELDDAAFKRALNAVDITPEKVGNLLFSKNPSEVKRLMGNLSESGKAKARSAVIQRALLKAIDGEDLSPQKFANEIERLGSNIGVVFEGADVTRIEGLTRLIKATQQASVAAAAPPTGVQNSVPILAAVMADFMGSAGGAITSSALAGFAARAYESATVRNLLIGLGKTKPGSAGERSYIQRIEKVLASQSGLNMNAANDDVGMALAADEPSRSQ